MVQQVKELALSLLWLWLLPWRGFDPWLRNFCLLWVQPKKKRKRRKRKRKKKKVQFDTLVPFKAVYSNSISGSQGLALTKINGQSWESTMAVDLADAGALISWSVNGEGKDE